MIKHIFKDFGNFRKFGRKKVKRIYEKIPIHITDQSGVSYGFITEILILSKYESEVIIGKKKLSIKMNYD